MRGIRPSCAAAPGRDDRPALRHVLRGRASTDPSQVATDG